MIIQNDICKKDEMDSQKDIEIIIREFKKGLQDVLGGKLYAAYIYGAVASKEWTAPP